jgi:hypothetical protein
MDRIATTLISFTIVLIASAASASAQVNCNAAPNPTSRANCQRAMIGIYQEQARNQDAITRDLGRAALGVERMQDAAGWVANRHPDSRVGATWDGARAAGQFGAEQALRNPHVRNWNNRLYGQ